MGKNRWIRRDQTATSECSIVDADLQKPTPQWPTWVWIQLGRRTKRTQRGALPLMRTASHRGQSKYGSISKANSAGLVQQRLTVFHGGAKLVQKAEQQQLVLESSIV